MMGNREKYENYRHRAEQLRAAAESMPSPETREIMFRMAAEYAKMAEVVKGKLSKPH